MLEAVVNAIDRGTDSPKIDQLEGLLRCYRAQVKQFSQDYLYGSWPVHSIIH